MSNDYTVTLTLGGEQVTFRLGDMNAVDAGDFRRQVGVSLMQAIAGGSLDLDIVAGLLWLTKRRDNPKLAYHAVAAQLTYADLEDIDGAEQPDEPDEENIDPEA